MKYWIWLLPFVLLAGCDTVDRPPSNPDVRIMLDADSYRTGEQIGAEVQNGSPDTLSFWSCGGNRPLKLDRRISGKWKFEREANSLRLDYLFQGLVPVAPGGIQALNLQLDQPGTYRIHVSLTPDRGKSWLDAVSESFEIQ